MWWCSATCRLPQIPTRSLSIGYIQNSPSGAVVDGWKQCFSYPLPSYMSIIAKKQTWLFYKKLLRIAPVSTPLYLMFLSFINLLKISPNSNSSFLRSFPKSIAFHCRHRLIFLMQVLKLCKEFLKTELLFLKVVKNLKLKELKSTQSCLFIF